MESSASIEFLSDGIVAPMTREWIDGESGRPCFDGGVFYSNGEVCKIGIQKKQAENRPHLTDFKNVGRSDGGHVFGGMLQNTMFGHFLVESLARLWALNYLDGGYKNIVFYKRDFKQDTAHYVDEIIKLLFTNVSWEVAAAPRKFETLAVPSQIVMPNGHMYGHPVVREMCKRLPRHGKVSHKQIFVSRSRQKEYSSNIIGEDLIDRYLIDEGYTVIYPEEHSVAEQTAIYASADNLIFSDGSALHLYALVSRPDQKAFVIYRRLGEHFGAQLKSFGGPLLEGTPCISRLWLPDNVPQHYSLAQGGKALLDFPKLSEQLKNRGFIKKGLWPEFSVEKAEEIVASLQRPGRQYNSIALP